MLEDFGLDGGWVTPTERLRQPNAKGHPIDTNKFPVGHPCSYKHALVAQNEGYELINNDYPKLDVKVKALPFGTQWRSTARKARRQSHA
jgi:hypothetical protein